jgi:hypothetical protein
MWTTGRRLLSSIAAGGPCSTTAASRGGLRRAEWRAYTAIGGADPARRSQSEEVSMQSIRAWLLHPKEAPQIMNANASYVFFTEQALAMVPGGGRRACR